MTRLLTILGLLVLGSAAYAAEITGRIYLKAPQQASLAVGYVAVTSAGTEISNMAGLTMGNAGHVTCTTYAPRNTSVYWDATKGATFSHVGLPQGRYLMYVRYGDWYYDWQLVDIPSSTARLSKNLSVNLADSGHLTIKIVRHGGNVNIRLTPYGANGKPLLPKDVFNYSFGKDISTSQPVASVRGLKAGTYLLELRAEQKQTSGGGSFSTYTDIGSWVITVQSGKTLTYSIP